MLRETCGQEPHPYNSQGCCGDAEQMLAAPNVEERFGERSYAIISDKYLISLPGWATTTASWTPTAAPSARTITFSFKGGAADDVRRSRRVRAIAIVLMGLDFSVEVKGDRVDARLQKYESPVIQEKLDLIGRLLIFTRQMDMLMTSEAGVEAVAQNFLQGNYSLDMGAIAGGQETTPGSPAVGDSSNRRAGK
jgi:pyruvate,water dikinase